MLRTPLAGLLALCFAANALAESQPYKAVVIDPEVKLRAGADDRFPETQTLRKGAEVTVEEDAGNGWVAVTAYGSVSWVQAAYIEDPTPGQDAPKNVFVNGEDDVTVAAGKVGLNQPLDIRRVKIPHGTTLFLLGPKAEVFQGATKRTWYMIQSPPGDLRYMPKSALEFKKAAGKNFTVKINETITPVPPGADSGSKSFSATPAGGAVASIPGPSAITPASAGGTTASKPAVNHPLWEQAEAAERENRLTDAEKLYFKLAAEINRSNGEHDIANLCYTRIHAIREKQRGVRAPAPAPNVLRPPVRDEFVGARTSTKDDRGGVRVGTPEPLPPAANKGDRADWHTGRLVYASSTPDGPNRQVYLLETPNGVVTMYVAPGPGVDLARHVGKRVSVLGTPTTRRDLVKPYMVATDVEAAR